MEDDKVAQQQKLKIARLKKLIERLKQKFPPATDENSCDHLLSTEDVIEIMLQHDTSISVEDTDLVDMLEKAGYKFEAIEEDEKIGFKWLMGPN